MDDVLINTRTNFRQIRAAVEEQLRLQAQIGSGLPKHNQEPIITEKSPERNNNENNPTQHLNENKSDATVRFKITGDTFYKVIDLLNNRNLEREGASRTQSIYDYLPSDILCVNLRVNRLDTLLSSHSSNASSSSESDSFKTQPQCNSCEYISMNKISDKPKKTKDYSFNKTKDSHNVRVDSRIYYDRYQNPRIERRYTSIIDEPAQTDSSKYQGAITEIVQTEYTYVAGLHYLYENYILYFQGEQEKRLLKMEPFFRIFEQIFWKQSEFYKGLLSCKSIEDVASHFVDNVKLFEMYRNYILNFKTALNHLIVEYRFDVLKRQQELGNPTSFEDYLLFPMQRLSKYILLLEESQSDLQQNWQMSSKIAVILRILKKILTSSEADAKIVDSITSRPTSLVNYGCFIMKESFYVRKIRTTSKLTIFLFQDVIIFTAPEEDHFYSYQYHIPMKKLSMRVVVDNPISFEVMDFDGSKDREKDMYVLETVDPRTKEIWVEVIESLLWEQLLFYKNNLDGNNPFKDKLI